MISTSDVCEITNPRHGCIGRLLDLFFRVVFWYWCKTGTYPALLNPARTIIVVSNGEVKTVAANEYCYKNVLFACKRFRSVRISSQFCIHYSFREPSPPIPTVNPSASLPGKSKRKCKIHRGVGSSAGTHVLAFVTLYLHGILW